MQYTTLENIQNIIVYRFLVLTVDSRTVFTFPYFTFSHHLLHFCLSRQIAYINNVIWTLLHIDMYSFPMFYAFWNHVCEEKIM